MLGTVLFDWIPLTDINCVIPVYEKFGDVSPLMALISGLRILEFALNDLWCQQVPGDALQNRKIHPFDIYLEKIDPPYVVLVHQIRDRGDINRTGATMG